MRTRIKFCGLVRSEDVDAAVALGADAVGLVFYPRSPRALDTDEARRLRRRLPSFVRAVGLFVNDPPERIARVAHEVGLDVLQLHGDESPDACAEAAREAGDLPWWRAVRMRSPGDLIESRVAYAGAECLLLDAWSEGYGGSGHGFDWSWIAPQAVGSTRCILSGGLGAEVVAEAIERVAPFAVDVSTGIQGASPREKDAAKMERFVAAVAAADAKRAGRR